MSLTAGKGSDDWQTATTDAEAILSITGNEPAPTTIYVMSHEDNTTLALLNIPILHGSNFVPIPKGSVLPFTHPQGIKSASMKMASGTGSVGWGIGASR